MKLPSPNLRPDCDGKKNKENNRAGCVPQVQRHGERVATGLAQRGRGNLDNPEADRDLRHLAKDFAYWMRCGHFFRCLIARSFRNISQPARQRHGRRIHAQILYHAVSPVLKFDRGLLPGSV